jgi:hypothetical protein
LNWQPKQLQCFALPIELLWLNIGELNILYLRFPMKYEIWNMKYEIWNMKYEIWNTIQAS